jgi:hypothetical protein
MSFNCCSIEVAAISKKHDIDTFLSTDVDEIKM